MALPVFIGDEVTAAGYRLAGVEVRVPGAPGETAREIQRARDGGATLVLVSAGLAGDVPDAALDDAIAAAAPPVVIVPDAAGRGRVPDLASRVRSRIGLE